MKCHNESIPRSTKDNLPNALFVLQADSLDLIYGPQEKKELQELANFTSPPQTSSSLSQDLSLLNDVEVIFSGWGAPLMDQAFLDAAPNLKAVFYGAGSVKNFVTEAFWDRKISLSSAYAANAQPVAEYSLAVILLSLKHFWRFSAATKHPKGWGDGKGAQFLETKGCFRTTVGLVSMGMIARYLLKLLKPFDLNILVFCPFMSEAEATDLGVELCALPDLFKRSDVVSLHTPSLPETQGLITGNLINSMKHDATLINTSRGAIIKENEMTDVLKERTDLTAVLDVCNPEPPLADSPLLSLPNVVMTPHISGSVGPECQRLGRFMVNEFQCYLEGLPLQWEITREAAKKLA